MARVSRRRLLAAGATAIAAGLSGCIDFDGDGAVFVGETECFESVSYESGLPPITPSTLTVEKSPSCPVEYLVLLDSGKQFDAGRYSTGEAKVEVNVPARDTTVEVLAVVGGQISDRSHAGGEIAERVAVEVNS